MNRARGRREDRRGCENNSQREKTATPARNACDAAGSLKTSTPADHGAKDKPRFTASERRRFCAAATDTTSAAAAAAAPASVIVSHNAECELLKKSSYDVAILRKRRSEDRPVALIHLSPTET